MNAIFNLITPKQMNATLTETNKGLNAWTIDQLTRMLDFAANYFDTWHARDSDIAAAAHGSDVHRLQMLLDGRKLVERMQTRPDQAEWREVAIALSAGLDRVEGYCRYRWEQMQAPWFCIGAPEIALEIISAQCE